MGPDDIQHLVRGRYAGLAALGAGGQGTTFSAKDEHGHDVVLKVFDLKTARHWQDHRLFEREVAALRRVEHPFVPAFRAVIEDDSQQFRVLVMDRVLGMPLHLWKPPEDVSPEALVWILRDAAEALSAIHAAGLIHRDIKPANLIVDEESRVHVVDLGVVALDRAAQDSIGSTIVVGTPGFMAPEVQFGASPATDVYSLGVTFLSAILGRDPLTLPRTGLSIDVASALPSAGRELRELLIKMVSPEPAARIASMKSILVEATKILNDSGRSGALTISGGVPNSEELIESWRPFESRVAGYFRTLLALADDLVIKQTPLEQSVLLKRALSATWRVLKVGTYAGVAIGGLVATGVGAAAGTMAFAATASLAVAIQGAWALDEALRVDSAQCPHCAAKIELPNAGYRRRANAGFIASIFAAVPVDDWASFRCVFCGGALGYSRINRVNPLDGKEYSVRQLTVREVERGRAPPIPPPPPVRRPPVPGTRMLGLPPGDVPGDTKASATGSRPISARTDGRAPNEATRSDDSTRMLVGDSELTDGDAEGHIVEVLTELGFTAVEIRNGELREAMKARRDMLRGRFGSHECRFVPRATTGEIEIFLIDRKSRNFALMGTMTADPSTW
jgi:non-specific serine/threonine protein kinase